MVQYNKSIKLVREKFDPNNPKAVLYEGNSNY